MSITKPNPTTKPKKRGTPFNRMPINPPKDFKDRDKLPNFNFRMLPR